MSYKAFISYCHSADKELAAAIQGALQSFAKPWYRKYSMLLFRDDPYCHFLGLGIQSTVLGLGRTAPQARRTRRSAIHPAKTAKNHIPPTRLSRCSFVSPLCSCAKAPVRLRTTQTCNSTTRISLRQTRADAIDRHAPSQDTPCILDLVLIAVKTRILPLKLSCSHTLPFL